MKETGILFTTPMVRALLDGSKTQTRRVCKPAQFYSLSTVVEVPDPMERGQVYNGSHFGDEEGEVQFASPYGGPGDRLWVREAHYLTDDGETEYAVYAADDLATYQHLRSIDALPSDFPADVKAQHRRLRPSIHMPRWASRITLEITSVRVERLQDISDADAQAEGCPCYVCGGVMDGLSESDCHCFHKKAKASDYRNLWEQINGPGSWDANPWVWAVSFRRLP